MNKDGEYSKIDLAKIANGLLRRIWIIMLAMVMGAVMLFSYAVFFVTPLYESSVLMYVNNSSFSVGSTSFSISSSEISAAKSLVETYQVILKTRVTLNDVIRLGELDYTYGELCEMIETESVNDTEVFSITVTSEDPYEAEHIANTIARVLPEKIAGIVEGSSVRVVDFAVVPSEKVSPSFGMYSLVGFAIGALLSSIVVVVLEILDDRIRTEDYLLQAFGNTPLLAVIPDMLDDKLKNQYYYARPTKKNGRRPKNSEQQRGSKKRNSYA